MSMESWVEGRTSKDNCSLNFALCLEINRSKSPEEDAQSQSCVQYEVSTVCADFWGPMSSAGIYPQFYKVQCQCNKLLGSFNLLPPSANKLYGNLELQADLHATLHCCNNSYKISLKQILSSGSVHKHRNEVPLKKKKKKKKKKSFSKFAASSSPILRNF
ncbi:hypothetical protein GOODEAATRI_006934 [Goodea atripinnis]|uniref:Uncharacterized protein n=1 Tax=Goodea atripinnis TaxID=208336 RepID=A0ABV0MSW4_9TELE